MKTQWKHYGVPVYEVESGTYAVCTDRQADVACREAIVESLWAFRPEFLVGYVPDGVDAEVIAAIVEKRCEDANPAILRLVGDRLDDLVRDAVAADGRGHFLSPYDGDERDSKEIDGLPRGRVAFRIS